MNQSEPMLKIDQMSAKLLYDQIKLNQPFSPQK